MTKSSNTLLDFFHNNKENAIHKWMHYFEIYDRYFSKYRDSNITILEIGVFQGGSLNMWKEYFGDNVKIYGIDINPDCQQFENEYTKIFIGSQDDRKFLQQVKDEIPKLDILIDDGGHTMSQQIVTFEELYEHVKDDGIYLIEDLHTSYWKYYGGGYKNPSSFIEYSKDFIDFLNAWHSEDNRLFVNNYTKTLYALHYYDSILIIEKKIVAKPETKITGNIIIDLEKFEKPVLNSPIKNKNILSFSYFKRLIINVIRCK